MLAHAPAGTAPTSFEPATSLALARTVAGGLKDFEACGGLFTLFTNGCLAPFTLRLARILRFFHVVCVRDAVENGRNGRCRHPSLPNKLIAARCSDCSRPHNIRHPPSTPCSLVLLPPQDRADLVPPPIQFLRAGSSTPWQVFANHDFISARPIDGII